MKSTLLVLGLAAQALATARTSAPSGCSTVAKSGGDYTTVQAAVDAAKEGGCIFIKSGTYSEQVYVVTDSLTIYGYTSDTSTYSGNAVTITASKSQDDGLDDDGTGTLRVHATDFKLYNVNVKNGRGQGSQAIALSAYGNGGYYGCSFEGYQDTILTEQGDQLYSQCQIVGATDFIFGQKSMAWFEQCDIRVLSASVGYVTANGASSSGASKYVFNQCDIAAASGNTVTSGAYYLGRPWADYANVVFQSTSMSSVINSKGWSQWSSSAPQTDHVTFAEYANSGSGSKGTRASFATTNSKAVAITSILGSSVTSAGYYDKNYM